MRGFLVRAKRPTVPRATLRRLVHLALLAVQVLFASFSIAAKGVLTELEPFALASARAAAAAALLALLALARRRWRMPAREIPGLAGLAVLGIAANQLLFIAGLARTTATMALVLGTTIPVFTAALAIVLGREAPAPRRLVGIAIGLGGAVVAILWNGGGDGGERSLVGDLLIVVNSVCYAAYLVLSRGVLARHDSLLVTTWVLVLGAVLVVPVGAADAVAAAPRLSAEVWAGLAWIVVGATVGAYALNAWALARAEASVVAIYIYVQPVLGAALAAIFLGERPGPGTIAGGAAIAVGIWLVTRPPRRR